MLWSKHGTLLPMFLPTVRKICSCDLEKLLKCEAGGWEFAKILRSLEVFIGTEKGMNNFETECCFLLVPEGFSQI